MDSREQTKVLLTADIEFSSGGYFDDPNCSPVGLRSVELEINGRSHGIGFMLETLSRYGIPATMFIEAAHVLYFGEEAMAGIANRLRDAGHDLQLHLHPMWLAFDPLEPRFCGDSLARLDRRSVECLVDVGLRAFDEWRLPRPLAVRAGNLEAGRSIYSVMESRGLHLASHIGLAVFQPRESELQLRGGRHWIGEVLEIPILSYRAFDIRGRRKLRLLTIAGTSFAEMRALLETAYANGVQDIVLLTHAHEFIKRSDIGYSNIRPNRVTQDRLEQLCQFLSANASRFRPTTFSECAADWVEKPSQDILELEVPALRSMARMVENKLCDTIWRW